MLPAAHVVISTVAVQAQQLFVVHKGSVRKPGLLMPGGHTWCENTPGSECKGWKWLLWGPTGSGLGTHPPAFFLCCSLGSLLHPHFVQRSTPGRLLLLCEAGTDEKDRETGLERDRMDRGDQS